MLREHHTEGSHDAVLELVAVSTIEMLSVDEEALVSEHLGTCKECSEAAKEYKAITGYGRALPKLAVEDEREALWDSEKQKRRLLARLDLRQDRKATIPKGWRGIVLSRSLQWSAAAALVIFTSVAVGYQAGIRQAPVMSAMQTAPIPREIKSAEAYQNQISAELAEAKERVSTTEKRIAELEAAISKTELARMELQTKNKELTAQAARGEHALETTAKERGEVADRLLQKDKLLQTVQQELNELRDQRSREVLRAANAEFRMQQISSEISQKNQTIARQQQLLESDRDIRELMGARQLHIADVLDIDKDGHNRKPFGRIFYTKGKSLMFYAFDLDQQPGIKNASVFHAWGQSDGKSKGAVSLGIFYLDSESNHRWVVKAENPELLTQLDAVFVTVEKNGNSKQPTGKPFLYTYLRKVAPNHP